MTMPRPSMWIDVDEVLNEYRMDVLRMANQLFGRTLNPDDNPGTAWDIFEIFPPQETERLLHLTGCPGFCESLTVREGAPEAVEEFRKYVDLFVVTSPFDSRNWVFERERWLKKHFGFDRGDIIHASAKYRINADLCLDDKISNVVKWQEHHPNGRGMIWPAQHTRNMPAPEEMVVRGGWSEAIHRVKSYAGC